MTGNELRIALEEAGVTRAGLAEILDVAESTVYRWLSSRDEDLPTLAAYAIRYVLREAAAVRSEDDLREEVRSLVRSVAEDSVELLERLEWLRKIVGAETFVVLEQSRRYLKHKADA